MTQTMYTHVNKWIIKILIKKQKYLHGQINYCAYIFIKDFFI
jgi:hypothetical protein